MPPTTRAQQVARNKDSALKVFLIPELLERILLNTTFIDLFVLQRVSKVFQITISDSPTPQRKLLTPEFHQPTKREVVARLLTNLQLAPFEIRPFSAYTLREPNTVTLRSDKNPTRPLGWKGTRAVHEHGGWEKLKWGVEGFWMQVSGLSGNGWQLPFREVELEGTVGEMVEVLRGLEGVMG